jgi:DNA-binding CsgD family transcriptional regulator
VVEAFGYEVAESPSAPPEIGGTPGEPDSAEPIGYRQAYALLRRAEARLIGGGDRRLVADDLAGAHLVAERLAAAPLAGAVRKLADQAGVGVDGRHRSVRPGADGGDPPDSRNGNGGKPGAGPLTPRELSVLTLVADGRTNRQVGSELFISEKTVSVHLSRVMAKLGAASRTEAVNLAYTRGLLAPPAVSRSG